MAFVSRWRVALALVLVGALVLGLGIWYVQVNILGRDSALDCSKLEAEDFAQAGALADECGAEVEVLSSRTPWQSSWATPDSSVRLELSAVPVRVEKEGKWDTLDTSLEARPDAGTISVAAPVFPMELNAGGVAGTNDPLGSISREGKQLDVWFPLPLPEPTLTESQAVYELGEGIALYVSISVDGTGFLPVVKLDDEAAATRLVGMLDAARPAIGSVSQGADLEFTTAVSEGLSLTKDDEGAVHVVDAEGETHFLATPPLMWDSAGVVIPESDVTKEVGATDRTRNPADGDAIASMDMELAGDKVVISPDETMLEDADTVWPVYIDPSFSGKGAASWEAVRSGGYTGTLHQWGDLSSSSPGQGAGYCSATASCIKVFKQRLAWRFTGLTVIKDLVGSEITSAQFRVNGTHSASCTAARTDLYRTSALSTSSTWSNLSWTSLLGSRTEAHSASCGNRGFKEFNALTGIRWAADNDQTAISMGLKANNETTMTGWKRFRHDATLQVVYNRTPLVPTSLQLTSPAEPSCVTGASRPVIAATAPTVSAISSDPDAGNVQTSFEVATVAAPTVVKWSATNLPGLASGSRRAAVIPSGTLVDGESYTWRSRAFDGALYSAWSAPCEFTVDVSKPLGPIVTPIVNVVGVNAVYYPDRASGGVGLMGKFKIDGGSTSDVVAFVYGFNDPTSTSTVTPDSSGVAAASFTPTTTGPVTLSVKSRDAAGNVSLPTNYTFSVAVPAEDAIWALDEGSGATADDSAGDPAQPLSIDGASWGAGPHSLFNSRAGDAALVFDGTNDSAATDTPVVTTTESFVVSAHVRLNAGSTGQGKSYTALSQDGVQDGIERSGFKLQYAATCPAMPSGCWSFSMPDSGSSSTIAAANSSVPVKTGEWTHLVGEYDKADQKVRLWVCDIGTPANPATGDPIKTEAARTAPPWAATGSFVVGRGLDTSIKSGWWPGAVDNVRVFSGEVIAESKIRRLCQGAEATDFNDGDIQLDPTTEVD
ncbi:MAG: LamG-like jellyroll fold domain-containing protein [Microbacteriaceae bacterium]